MTLPGRCITCGADVVWSRRAWRRPGQGGHLHRCAPDRPLCAAWMPYARERCARGPGHLTEHRTAYAMANQYRAHTGRERVA